MIDRFHRTKVTASTGQGCTGKDDQDNRDLDLHHGRYGCDHPGRATL